MLYHQVVVICAIFTVVFTLKDDITVNPDKQFAPLNSSASFTCTQSNSSYANGTAWFFNGTQLINGSESRIFYNSFYLSIDRLTKRDTGVYECRNRWNKFAFGTLVVYRMPDYFHHFLWVSVPIFAVFAVFLLVKLCSLCRTMCRAASKKNDYKILVEHA